MTPESEILLAMAQRVADAHRSLPGVVAAMVTGSVAKGLADGLSDIDMAVYYQGALPDDAALGAVAAGLGASGRRPLGPRDPDGFIEAFELPAPGAGAVEVQLIHASTHGFQAELDEVLVKHAVDTPLHKALEGTLVCRALYGDPWIEGWRADARAFPPALGDAMIRHYLSFFPAWAVLGQFQTRDAAVWYQQILVESAQKLLGALAGLNHVYYTPFQHKRLGRFVDGLALAPMALTARIQALFGAPPEVALPALEALVAETLDLIEAHRPHIDVSATRRRIGARRTGWRR